MINDIDIFKESTKPKESIKTEKKVLTLKNAIILLNRRRKVLNAFEYLQNENILSWKQMLQRLPIALGQVKAGNTFEN